jgi:ABC-2 type transport system permease protein
MSAFFKYLCIQFKMDLRDKGILMTYYLVPLLFFVVVGSVFSSVNPLMKSTLAASMSIFAVTMGAIMGTPIPIVKARETGTLRALRVSGIPSAAVLFVQAISALLHLAIVCVIIYFVSPVLLHSSTPKSPASYAVTLMIFLMVTIAVGLLIGSLARNQSMASMLSMIVFFPTVMLSGIMFPSSMLPQAFRLVGYVFPATYALQTITGLAYGVETDINPGISMCVLVGIGLVALAIAIWRFGSIRQSEQA